jgi:hypothetical protein
VNRVPPVRLEEGPFLEVVEQIVGMAEARGFPLRVVGSVGIYCRIRGDPHARGIYLHRHGIAHDGTPRFKDLDLASLEKYSSRIYKLFVKELNYTEDRETNALFGMYRNIYFHPHFSIDIFYDALRFSHEIPLKGRFPPGPTLAPEDLLLGKVQIHAITPPDLADIAALLVHIPIGRMDQRYLGGLFGEDWGLWYDARNNLEQAHHRLTEWAPNDRGLTAENLHLAKLRIDEAIRFLDAVPKSRRWEKRAARGIAEPWFEEVDEIR